nr:zinc finger protein CG30 [Ectropis obliqua nucleopolyhedrovirus]
MCLHTLCFTCVSKLAKGKELKCPFCRTINTKVRVHAVNRCEITSFHVGVNVFATRNENIDIDCVEFAKILFECSVVDENDEKMDKEEEEAQKLLQNNNLFLMDVNVSNANQAMYGHSMQQAVKKMEKNILQLSNKNNLEKHIKNELLKHNNILKRNIVNQTSKLHQLNKHYIFLQKKIVDMQNIYDRNVKTALQMKQNVNKFKLKNDKLKKQNERLMEINKLLTVKNKHCQ